MPALLLESTAFGFGKRGVVWHTLVSACSRCYKGREKVLQLASRRVVHGVAESRAPSRMPSLSAHVGAREARASGVRFAADAAAAARGGGDATNTATSAAPARLPEADRAVVARRASARRRASAGASTLTAIRETSPRSHPASHPTPARVYRQPDGTLGPRRPPREPHVVAARKEWADLVHHARTHGGDENATAGRCFRHGVGVLYAEHRCARTRTRREDRARSPPPARRR